MAQTVFVGLSGGVDSSVTAALLQQQGYRVVGVYMKNWTEDLPGAPCPWKADLADARRVAAKLDIPLKIYDFQKQYKQRVVDYMVAEYEAGRTPNPDVMCNQEIKFKLFFEAAMADGADLIATGHYARTSDGKLLRAKDANKDQTYFLYRVSGEVLQKTLLPIGDYAKPEIRELAAKFKLPTATKKDSQGICFVGSVGIKEFLWDRVHHEAGPIVQPGKGVVGQHEGAVFYTIGQRHGLGVGGGKPLYVTGKSMTDNTVYVTDNPEDLELNTKSITITQSHWINSQPKPETEYQIRLRHRGQLMKGKLTKVQAGYQIELVEQAHAVAAGQSAAVYDGEVVLGGGIITA